jgi:hypothetical protein
VPPVLEPILGPRRSRVVRAGAVLAALLLGLFAAACVVEARVEGAWGSVTLGQGRLHLRGGRPFPVPTYASRVRWRPAAPDLMFDGHSYPAVPAAAATAGTPARPARAAWWFVRVPLWAPAAAVGLPVFAYWTVLVRRRPPWACRGCGYDTRGLTAPACPECGRAR